MLIEKTWLKCLLYEWNSTGEHFIFLPKLGIPLTKARQPQWWHVVSFSDPVSLPRPSNNYLFQKKNLFNGNTRINILIDFSKYLFKLIDKFIQTE